MSEKKSESTTARIERALANKTTTVAGAYQDTLRVLDRFSTQELAEYFTSIGEDSPLRSYLMQQIAVRETVKDIARSKDGNAA